MSKASRRWKLGTESIFHIRATLKDYRKMKRYQDRMMNGWKKDHMIELSHETRQQALTGV